MNEENGLKALEALMNAVLAMSRQQRGLLLALLINGVDIQVKQDGSVTAQAKRPDPGSKLQQDAAIPSPGSPGPVAEEPKTTTETTVTPPDPGLN